MTTNCLMGRSFTEALNRNAALQSGESETIKPQGESIMKKSEFLAKFGITVSATLTLTGNAALKAVESDGDALRYVKEQTEPICLKAVERNGDALQYVKEQTEPICLKAVESDGYALRYVKEQTEPICLKAVESDGDALRYVDIDTFEEDGE